MSSTTQWRFQLQIGQSRMGASCRTELGNRIKSRFFTTPQERVITREIWSFYYGINMSARKRNTKLWIFEPKLHRITLSHFEIFFVTLSQFKLTLVTLSHLKSSRISFNLRCQIINKEKFDTFYGMVVRYLNFRAILLLVVNKECIMTWMPFNDCGVLVKKGKMIWQQGH